MPNDKFYCGKVKHILFCYNVILSSLPYYFGDFIHYIELINHFISSGLQIPNISYPRKDKPKVIRVISIMFKYIV